MQSRTEGTVRSKKKEQVVQVIHIIQIGQKAAQAVGNLKETDYDIRFNSDVFCPGVLHPKDQGQLKKEYQLAQDAQSMYLDLLQKAGNQLKILPHKVDGNSRKVEDMELFKGAQALSLHNASILSSTEGEGEGGRGQEDHGAQDGRDHVRPDRPGRPEQLARPEGRPGSRQPQGDGVQQHRAQEEDYQG